MLAMQQPRWLHAFGPQGAAATGVSSNGRFLHAAAAAGALIL